MKKILLASTAVVLSAGVAAADVTISGNGRMGITYFEDISGANADELAFTSRIRIIFAASGETDGGLTFGGTIRADNAAGGNVGTAGTVFVSMGGMKLTMGDIDSAAEKAVGDISGVGFSGVTNNGLAVPNNGSPFGGDVNETMYLTSDNAGSDEGALFEYSMSGLSFYASAGQPQQVSGNEYSVAAKYSAGTYSVGLGYEDKDTVGSQWILGGSAGFGAATVKAQYASFDGDFAGTDFDQYGISLDYVFGATTVTGFYRAIDFDVAGGDTDFIGIGASYDLGGGAALKGGLISVDTDGLPTQMRADFGMTMTF